MVCHTGIQKWDWVNEHLPLNKETKPQKIIIVKNWTGNFFILFEHYNCITLLKSGYDMSFLLALAYIGIYEWCVFFEFYIAYSIKIIS